MANKSTCSIDGCERKVQARDFCNPHFIRWKRYGDPLAGATFRSHGKLARPGEPVCVIDECLAKVAIVSLQLCNRHYRRLKTNGSTDAPFKLDAVARYFSRVDRSGGPDACHPWTGKVNTYGYAVMHLHERDNAYIQTWAYKRFVGPIPDGQVVRHTCNNPPCQNYERHWVLGSQADNIHDAIGAGRHQYGEDHPSARLTELDVLSIRERIASGEPQNIIAVEYGVRKETISSVWRGITWKHVGGPTRDDHPLRTLGVTEVYEIRRATGGKGLRAALARQYGVGWTTIDYIRKRRTWVWLPEETQSEYDLGA